MSCGRTFDSRLSHRSNTVSGVVDELNFEELSDGMFNSIEELESEWNYQDWNQRQDDEASIFDDYE
jgi:hypothetical protein